MHVSRVLVGLTIARVVFPGNERELSRVRFFQQLGANRVATILATALLSFTFFAASLADFARAQSTKPRTGAATIAKEQPVPFRVGETLSYRVSWSAFSNAASLLLGIPEHRDLFGFQTWHFRGEAHTQTPVRNLFPIDDQFDSYTDAITLVGRQFEAHQNEMGKSSNLVQRFSTSGQPTHLPPPLVMVPPGTRDALGALYALRAADWTHLEELRMPVYDGHQLYELRAAREATSDPVSVAAGKYTATRISIRLFQYEKELTAVHYVIWIANDSIRTPALMEADLPFGTIRAELTSATN
jgi:hypothetical protein